MKILQITTRGMKNLDSDITLTLCNSTVYGGLKNITHVNGIYGDNGSGKTAFMTSVELYIKVCRSRRYLAIEDNQKLLDKLINKKIGEFYFEIVFTDEKDADHNIYKHTLLIKRDLLDRSFAIENETFSILKGRTLNEKYTEIYSFRNGEPKFSLIKTRYTEAFEKIIKNKTNCSFISLFIYSLVDGKKFLEPNDHISRLFILAYSVDVFLLDEDKHYEIPNDIKDIKPDVLTDKKKIEGIIKKFNEALKVDRYTDNVHKSKIKDYERMLKYLLNFLKIFKSDLLNISYESKNAETTIKCRKQFYYDKNLPIDIEFESSGIKHLVLLHSYFQNYLNGGIVFIDELDVNINSIVLDKLTQFLIKYGRGQLFFTSHNLEPMNNLKGKNTSLNIVGYSHNIDTWISNGSYTPRNYYKNGNFEHSPFNIEDFDFLSAFRVEGL